jgi:hypothetical protein
MGGNEASRLLISQRRPMLVNGGVENEYFQKRKNNGQNCRITVHRIFTTKLLLDISNRGVIRAWKPSPNME